jgi:hypothetical protein
MRRLVNAGRKSASVALRGQFHQRDLAELVFNPNWSGDDKAVADREQLSMMVGRRF